MNSKDMSSVSLATSHGERVTLSQVARSQLANDIAGTLLSRALILVLLGQMVLAPLASAAPHVTTKATAPRASRSMGARKLQAPTPSLDSVAPTSAPQGQTVTVTLHGTNTHWASGQTTA